MTKINPESGSKSKSKSESKINTSVKINIITNNVIEKIQNSPKDTYVIFYRLSCEYCLMALKKLRETKYNYKGYNIDNINVSLKDLLDIFIKNKSALKFNPNHKTIPIVFFNGKYIGGSDDLIKRLDNNNNI